MSLTLSSTSNHTHNQPHSHLQLPPFQNDEYLIEEYCDCKGCTATFIEFYGDEYNIDCKGLIECIECSKKLCDKHYDNVLDLCMVCDNVYCTEHMLKVNENDYVCKECL
jgi:hypothetical protein